MVREAKLIVVGTVLSREDVANVADLSRVGFKPESFLKGSPSAANLAFEDGMPQVCEAVRARSGERYLLLVSSDTTPVAWPAPGRVYRLADGQAQSSNRGDPHQLAEADLVGRIRAQTNQFSQPAAASGDGAGIDWVSTVLPVGGALVGLLIVGLVLMRVWHRIDPT